MDVRVGGRKCARTPGLRARSRQFVLAEYVTPCPSRSPKDSGGVFGSAPADTDTSTARQPVGALQLVHAVSRSSYQSVAVLPRRETL